MNEETQKYKYSILIVDDETTFRKSVNRFLKKHYHTIEAADGHRALELAKTIRPELVLLDIGLPDMSGLEVLEKLKETEHPPAVIMVTAYDQVKDVVHAMKLGASNYLVKPIDIDEFDVAIKNALETVSLKKEIEGLKGQLKKAYKLDRLIGSSPAFIAAQKLAIKSAESADASILLQGESGVGKELFAKLIHFHSPRAASPLLALNCAAFASEIVESELFGHEPGSFTGARQSGKKGLLEAANEGSLFLDEVADLGHDIQAKLLRVLEEKEFYPVGGTRKKHVDVRFIAACNRDLWLEVKKGNFRPDLYFRLATIKIELPPLRKRKEDIMPLTQFFMEKFNNKYGKRFRYISPEAQTFLENFNWPGNVRQLRNTIERIVLLEDDSVIRAKHLNFLLDDNAGDLTLPSLSSGPKSSGFYFTLPEDGFSLEEAEKAIIAEAYKKCSFNKTKTAKFLKTPRHILTYRLKKYGLS
ncbi:MAG: sigma-54-dependent Fis family transcriptional regulator [Deltaproteobacteria bacterium]|nr:MAG: sigma-54-dependent Fis family transcriptional regulator [Deltaproteobacteria bacterium]